MKVILNQDVKGQGKKGQLVEVSDGYARNFLLPRKLAVEASKENMNVMQGKHEAEEYRKQKELEEARETAKLLEEVTVSLKAKAGSSGKLFGSITSKDVSEALKMQHHIKLDKKKFVMPDGIKVLGITEVEVKVHAGVCAKLKVQVTEE